MRDPLGESLVARLDSLIQAVPTQGRLQDELIELRQELGVLVDAAVVRRRELLNVLNAVQSARSEVKRAGQVKSLFLSLLSHEIKTPVTRHRLQLELLNRTVAAGSGEGDREPRVHRLIDRLVDSSNEITFLMESLLEFADLQTGRIVLRLEHTDLAPLVKASVEQFQPLAEKNKTKLEFETPPRLAPLSVDRRLIEVILTQLLDCSLKSIQKGSLNVRLSCEGSGQSILVERSARWTTEQQRTVLSILENPERVIQAPALGLGIGIAILQQAADAVGGTVRFSSGGAGAESLAIVLP